MLQMKNPSLVLQSPRKVTIEDRSCPGINDTHTVLVQIGSTGICGSDLHYYNRGEIGVYKMKPPMVLGHESAGVVMEVGPDVTMVKVGDLVALEPGTHCRYCNYCRKGSYNLCRTMRFAATPPIDGTLCHIYSLPEDSC